MIGYIWLFSPNVHLQALRSSMSSAPSMNGGYTRSGNLVDDDGVKRRSAITRVPVWGKHEELNEGN